MFVDLHNSWIRWVIRLLSRKKLDLKREIYLQRGIPDLMRRDGGDIDNPVNTCTST